MSLLNPEPSAATREAVANHCLQHYNGRPTGTYDLLDHVLNRAKGVAGLIGASALEGDKSGLLPEYVHEAAFAVCEDIEKALLLLQGLCNTARPTATQGKTKRGGSP